jgi:hypothetical protein
MRELHPNLGASAWGRRKTVYVVTALVTAVASLTCVLTIGLGFIPGTPIDVYFSWAMFFILWLPFIALIDNPGEIRGLEPAVAGSPNLCVTRGHVRNSTLVSCRGL